MASARARRWAACVYVERRGTGDAGAPAVLLLHGLGSSADDWAHQLPLLTPCYRVLLVDLPGHRRSALPPGRLTVEAMAARAGRGDPTRGVGRRRASSLLFRRAS